MLRRRKTSRASGRELQAEHIATPRYGGSALAVILFLGVAVGCNPWKDFDLDFDREAKEDEPAPCEEASSLGWGGQGGRGGGDIHLGAFTLSDGTKGDEVDDDGTLNRSGRESMRNFGLDPDDPADRADYEFIFFSKQLIFYWQDQEDPSWRIDGAVYQLAGLSPPEEFEARIVDIRELMEARRDGRYEDAGETFRGLVEDARSSERPVAVLAWCEKAYRNCLWQAGSGSRAISGEAGLSNVQSVWRTQYNFGEAPHKGRDYYADFSVHAEFQERPPLVAEAACSHW